MTMGQVPIYVLQNCEGVHIVVCTPMLENVPIVECRLG